LRWLLGDEPKKKDSSKKAAGKDMIKQLSVKKASTAKKNAHDEVIVETVAKKSG